MAPRPRPHRVKRKGVAERLDLYAVCLIGWEGPRPTGFGDNQGGLFVRVATARKEVSAADRSDIESASVPIVVHEYVLVPSEAHAKRLKEALDEVLLGQQEEQMNTGGRHRWRNVRSCWDQDNPSIDEREFDRSRWWSEILSEAQRLLRPGATSFAIYGTPEDALADGEDD